jgi:hypothetical protein
MHVDEQRFKTVSLIRLSLVMGAVLFALVTYVQRRNGGLADSAMPEENLVRLRYIHWAIAAFAMGWALFWRSRMESAMTVEGVVQALIVGWAPGEAAALMGGVIYFTGGPPSALAFGFVAFAVVLSLLRIPRAPR